MPAIWAETQTLPARRRDWNRAPLLAEALILPTLATYAVTADIVIARIVELPDLIGVVAARAPLIYCNTVGLCAFINLGVKLAARRI